MNRVTCGMEDARGEAVISVRGYSWRRGSGRREGLCEPEMAFADGGGVEGTCAVGLQGTVSSSFSSPSLCTRSGNGMELGMKMGKGIGNNHTVF
jgi:hypothetical protein